MIFPASAVTSYVPLPVAPPRIKLLAVKATSRTESDCRLARNSSGALLKIRVKSLRLSIPATFGAVAPELVFLNLKSRTLERFATLRTPVRLLAWVDKSMSAPKTEGVSVVVPVTFRAPI